MNSRNRMRLDAEHRKCRGHVNKPSDLMDRVLSNEDFSDAAIVGGIAINDVISGAVHQWQIPIDVQQAFHLQYPNLTEDFAGAVHRLSDDPASLRGLVNGVRGKLFEVEYVKWLNDGHLPHGMTAHLAESANNAAWDVSVTDAHGHVDTLLQLKASEGIAAAHHALALHPDIDVVIPHDVFLHIGNHLDDYGHLIDGHERLSDLDTVMGQGVHHAELATSGAFHVPYISFVWVAMSTTWQYRTGRLTPEQALTKVAQGVATSTVAAAAAWGATLLLHKTIVGIPVAWWVGRKMRHWFNTKDQIKVLDQRISIISVSRESLERELFNRSLDYSPGSLTLLPN